MNRTLYRFVVFCLLLTMMGIITGIASPGLADTDLGVVGTEVHLPVILLTTLLYGSVLSRLFAAPKRFFTAANALLLCVPLLLYCMTSAAWSVDPSLSIRRSLFLVLTVAVGLIVGSDFEITELIELLGSASLFHLALCVGFYAVARHYLFSPQDPNALKGLTTHKNVFGFDQGVAVIALLCLPLRRHGWLRWLLAGIAFAALVWSHSSGSLLATLAALGCWPLFQIVRLRQQERLPVLLIVLTFVGGGVALLAGDYRQIPALFSKDITLTGRTELWSVLLVSIQHHLWIGYGFDSFWQGLQGESLNVIRAVGWLVPTAHNGYLDLLLSGGVIGAVLFLPLLAAGVRRALSYTVQTIDATRFFPALLLVFWLIYNLNESALLTRSGLPFFLFIAVTSSLSVPHPRTAIETRKLSFRDFYVAPAHSTRGDLG